MPLESAADRAAYFADHGDVTVTAASFAAVAFTAIRAQTTQRGPAGRAEILTRGNRLTINSDDCSRRPSRSAGDTVTIDGTAWEVRNVLDDATATIYTVELGRVSA